MPRATMLRSSSFALFAGLSALAGTPADAATRVWPALFGVGCTGTLQDCIDGAAAGDTVRIGTDDAFLPDSYTLIDEELRVGKSLTLEAAPGIDAVFASGRSIFVDAPGAAAITLRRLVLRSGRVRVTHRGPGATRYTLDQMRLEEAGGGPGECPIELLDRGDGAPDFVVGDSLLLFRERRPLRPIAICANGAGGPWQVSILRNRIESDPGTLTGGISVAGTSSGTVTLSGNELRVHGAVRGIRVSQNVGSSANVLAIHDNLVTGQMSAPSTAEAALLVSLSQTDLRLVNNTIARNAYGVAVTIPEGDTSFGRVANNLVAYNGVGMDLLAASAALGNSHNLMFGNRVDGVAAPGPGTLNVDPQFVGQHDFRLAASSPARDAGNNADVATPPGLAFDVGGEPRVANATVDIGAHEWTGDQSLRHVATADNALANFTRIEPLAAPGSAEHVLLTPLRGPVTGPELEQTLGVYQDALGANRYFAFHEDNTVDLAPGRRFHALVPALGVTSFLHSTTPGSVGDAYSRLSHPALDGNPVAIAFVLHNWNPGGGPGVYHDHRIGLDYLAPDWYVGNQDGAAMPSGRAFNLVVAPPGSPNAFVRAVGDTARRELRLEHPLLDDNECATLQVGRTGTTVNDTAFALEYRAGGGGAPGHWFIVALGAGAPAFPAGSAFNVMVAGSQAMACRVVRLFADGLE